MKKRVKLGLVALCLLGILMLHILNMVIIEVFQSERDGSPIILDGSSRTWTDVLFSYNSIISTGVKKMQLKDTLNTKQRDIDPDEGVTMDADSYDFGAKQRLPKLIIIGVSKCGTRALLSYLSLHHGMSCGSAEKSLPEINFFNFHYTKGLEWYRQQMTASLPGQITAEKSPYYFFNDQVPSRIKKMDPTIKLILSVCDPIERFKSQYAQNKENMEIKGHTFPPIDQRAVYPKGTLRNSSTIRRGCYYRYLTKWYETFPSSQILLVDGDQLKKRPLAIMTKIETFLGLKKYFSKSNFFFNKTSGFFCPAKDGKIVCLTHKKGRYHPPLNPKVETTMRTYYQDCSKPFFHLVNRTFDWFPHEEKLPTV